MPDASLPAHLPKEYGSYHQIYRVDGELVAMGVIDILPTCVSSVYFMYSPKWAWATFGKVIFYSAVIGFPTHFISDGDDPFTEYILAERFARDCTGPGDPRRGRRRDGFSIHGYVVLWIMRSGPPLTK
jgi:hypothetical protein